LIIFVYYLSEMKVFPFKIPKPENRTLIVQVDQGKSFYNKLHQHQEIQISLIVRGEGTYIIGDSVGEFNSEDIFVIGENLPHVFNCDLLLTKDVHMISLFFTQSSYGKEFFSLPDFKSFYSFFKDSSLGIKIVSNKKEIESLLIKIKNYSKLKQFITLLKILEQIVKSEKLKLSSLINTKKYEGDEGKRMQNIFEYTMQNFDKNISLNQISDVANMTPNSFCRYFKQRTNKTFISFLNDIRIGNACKLLTKNSDLGIAEISYLSGFNNLTNFNRKFKSVKGITPSEYRQKNK
jgi:AraC-like DNA-binding protein